jgi:ribosomal protein L37AE/L43A
MAKKKEVIEEEEEEVTCPVCGKPVGLNVPSCPHCGAEFEEVEAEEGTPAEEAPEEEGETAECPVCGKSVSLEIASCPYCGAEFEEEEVEEVIEVEEKVVPVKSKPTKYVPSVEEEEATAADAEEEALAEIRAPSNITDLRVIGVALIILGILGSQIAFMIDWYWTWVPPIESNLGMFVAIPAVIIVVGLLVFMLVKKALSGGKKLPRQLPGMSLSIFLFGIIALVLIMLWDPINSALQDQNVGVGVAFVGILIVGVLVMFMGQKMTAKHAAA